nr:hypothetical protein [Desulfobulbaceae bacterium]
MKKTMLIGLALGVVSLTASAAFAGTIVNSKHDLSATGASAGLGNGDSRICIFCHHPHNTVRAGSTAEGVQGNTLSYSPLWNRGIADDNTQFIAYNNGTNMGTEGQLNNDSSSRHLMNGDVAIGGVTLLCLSCHDGSTAMGAYSEFNPDFTVNTAGTGKSPSQAGVYGASGQGDTLAGLATGFGSGGIVDLSNHHPVGMSWDQVRQGDPEIAEKTNTFGGVVGGISIESVLTGGDTMECNACHDVHNTQSAANESFIWITNAGSVFCLSCHVK